MFEAIEFTRYLLLIFGIFEIISKFWPSTNFRQYLFSLPSPKFEQKPANLETKISRSVQNSATAGNLYQLPCEGGPLGAGRRGEGRHKENVEPIWWTCASK